ncbi:hypothetical protein IQ250_11405 [Pseudanabaenaceae cyanobacterium LEGE 13415]|nr:hypothetical protein [Pseudanabaenaceae cyanobacterium LEGE 13415]
MNYRNYVVITRELEEELFERGYTKNYSYSVCDRNWSKPGKAAITFAEAAKREGLQVEVKRCVRAGNSQWNQE